MRRDRLFYNARIETLAPHAAPAEAMVVAGGTIQFAGPTLEARRRCRPEAEEIDLGGRIVIPGLIDAHCHLLSYGLTRLRSADLLGAGSIAELQARLSSH